ncbi:hypothetical protein [uncultured Paraglaciecola sp.]|jgi:hypothetical protein|uniref:hypothetical protein n=1 Tax=uncultured Paraglaciecola sp. TaxID=1765024 RepID=UPI0025FFF20D|nr:hypothetical protein [uncultured Paraglaciecola sp.]
MMLETLSFISSKLQWLRPVVMLFGLIFLGLFCSSLFDIGHFIEEVYLIPSLAGLIWSVLFFILINAFENIPIKPDRKFAFFSKMKYWFVRLGYKILSVIFLLMSVAGLILSFRLFSVWFTQ